MIALYIIDNTEMPNWADFLQAIAGAVGMLLTIWTLLKLIRRDKEREAEIASLSQIANELRNMMVHNQTVFLEGKKPQIEATIYGDGYTNDVWLKIKNVNPQARLTEFKVVDEDSWVKETINLTTHGSTQEFSVNLKFKMSEANVQFNYTIDNVHKYSQSIKVYQESDYEQTTYKVAPASIENL